MTDAEVVTQYEQIKHLASLQGLELEFQPGNKVPLSAMQATTESSAPLFVMLRDKKPMFASASIMEVVAFFVGWRKRGMM